MSTGKRPYRKKADILEDCRRALAEKHSEVQQEAPLKGLFAHGLRKRLEPLPFPEQAPRKSQRKELRIALCPNRLRPLSEKQADRLRKRGAEQRAKVRKRHATADEQQDESGESAAKGVSVQCCPPSVSNDGSASMPGSASISIETAQQPTTAAVASVEALPTISELKRISNIDDFRKRAKALGLDVRCKKPDGNGWAWRSREDVLKDYARKLAEAGGATLPIGTGSVPQNCWSFECCPPEFVYCCARLCQRCSAWRSWHGSELQTWCGFLPFASCARLCQCECGSHASVCHCQSTSCCGLGNAGCELCIDARLCQQQHGDDAPTYAS